MDNKAEAGTPHLVRTVRRGDLLCAVLKVPRGAARFDFVRCICLRAGFANTRDDLLLTGAPQYW